MQALFGLKDFVEYCTSVDKDVITSDDLNVMHTDMVAVLRSTRTDASIKATRVRKFFHGKIAPTHLSCSERYSKILIME